MHDASFARLPVRIRDKILISESGCWMWTACVNSRWGYGQVHWKGKQRRAHRVVYEIIRGSCPAELDHLCHDPEQCAGGPSCPHRRCCNPAHLADTTHRDNLRRGNSPAGRQMRQETCDRGHQFDRIRESDGRRVCNTCKREKRREARILSGKPPGRTPPPHLRGEQSGHARLTDDAVRDIRERYAQRSATAAELSRIYGVGASTVWKVIYRQTWQHVA